MPILPEHLVTLAERVVRENAALGRTIALAESCTGGLVAAAITEVPGSSSVLDRGFVTYSNAAKQELLEVPEEVLDAFGAVSVATAWAMAQGALKHSSADVAVAVSGIAGAGGGAGQRPGRAGGFSRALRGQDEEVDAEERRFAAETRADVRLQAALAALELLLP